MSKYHNGTNVEYEARVTRGEITHYISDGHEVRFKGSHDECVAWGKTHSAWGTYISEMGTSGVTP